MSDRAEFEKQFPIPEDAEWNEKKQGYYRCDYQKVAHPFNDAWEVWQEALEYARAKSGQADEAEKVGVCVMSDLNDVLNEIEDYLDGRADADEVVGSVGPQPNEEMSLLIKLQAVRAQSDKIEND